MSFISDFAALARAGYKASDIKELIELSNRSQPETPKAAVVEEPAEIHQEDDWQPDNQEKTFEKPAEEPDEISAYKSEIADLKRQLEEAQKSNVSADISANNKTDPQTQLTEILQNLL